MEEDKEHEPAEAQPERRQPKPPPSKSARNYKMPNNKRKFARSNRSILSSDRALGPVPVPWSRRRSPKSRVSERRRARCHRVSHRAPGGKMMISKPVNTSIDFDWPDRFDSDNDTEITFNNRGPRPNAVGKQRRRVSHFGRIIA